MIVSLCILSEFFKAAVDILDGRLDIVVNVAGVVDEGADRWQQCVNINFVSLRKLASYKL